MKDNARLMAVFKDTSQRHGALILEEINTLMHGKAYRRSIDLIKLIPVWEWETRDPEESNDDKQIGLTVHILTRLQGAIDADHLKWASGYSGFDITKRLQLLAAVNAERRMLEIQLHIKPVMQIAEDLMPSFQVPSIRKDQTNKVAVREQDQEYDQAS